MAKKMQTKMFCSSEKRKGHIITNSEKHNSERFEEFSVSHCGICISQCEICIPQCGFCIPHCETENTIKHLPLYLSVFQTIYLSES